MYKYPKMQQAQEKKRGVGAPFRGRKFVQMRLLTTFTPDEIDYLREYADSHFPNLITLRRAKFEHENELFQTAQSAIRSMNKSTVQNDTLVVFINMTGTDTDKLTNEQHAQIFSVSGAGVSEFLYIPNSRKSTNTRAQYVLEKMQEFAKKHKGVTQIVPVVGYPHDAQSTKAYTSLQQEIAAHAGLCKCVSVKI